MKKGTYFLFLWVLVSCASQSPSIVVAPRTQVEAVGTKWMISTQGIETTKIANAIMKKGGNLVDAAIAASFAISVERPHSTGLGGGGFLIYHEAKTGKNHVFDFRERAPLASKKGMFLDSEGKVVPDLSVYGSLAIGTPGLVRGLRRIHLKFGKMDWKTLVEPAQKLAKEGFLVYPSLARAIRQELPVLSRFESTRKIFLHPDGNPFQLGERLIQEDLSQTLSTLSRNPEDFYSGAIAKKIAGTVQKKGGILTLEDLRTYSVKERKAIQSEWRGYTVITMPPPSSGGIHVLQILKMIEKDALEFQSPESIHLMASAMQSAFADRAVYLGDPDFVTVPVKELISEPYLQKRRQEIQTGKVRTKEQVYAGNPGAFEESANTTHFSLMDREGNVVVSTQTINGSFGSGLVAEGTGIILNNEMDDFAAKPGAANIFGALGGDANAVAPRKTPLSSMSPTLVLKKGKPVLAVGAPGGTRIITAVAQTILNHLYFGKDLYDSVSAARIHQQWSPDVLYVEHPSLEKNRSEISEETLEKLKKMGWTVNRASAQCHVMAVSRMDQDGVTSMTGVADPRDIGTSLGE